MLLIAGFVVSVAMDPGFAVRNAREALVSVWHMLGDVMIGHELSTLGGMIENARSNLKHAEALRDGLAARLQTMQVQRGADAIALAALDVWVEDDGRGLRVGDAWVSQDHAIAELSTVVRRMDHTIEANERALRAREQELFTLKALADARRARWALAGFDNALPRWESRSGFVAELLSSSGIRLE